MKIDPRQLMQLSAIVETGGLTEAAALLGSSQPALSRTLSLGTRPCSDKSKLPVGGVFDAVNKAGHRHGRLVHTL